MILENIRWMQKILKRKVLSLVTTRQTRHKPTEKHPGGT